MTSAEATPEAISDAIAVLLANASFAEVARRIAESIASMPSPDDVAAKLETLA